MIEDLQRLVNADPCLTRRGRWTNADLLLEIGGRGHVRAIREGNRRFEGTVDPLMATLKYLKLILETPRRIAPRPGN